MPFVRSAGVGAVLRRAHRCCARRANRPTDEILRLYALEALVARIVVSPRAEHLVLKGGVLLAAFDVRRPTRDVDLAPRQMSGDIETVLAAVREIASLSLDDGVEFGRSCHMCG